MAMKRKSDIFTTEDIKSDYFKKLEAKEAQEPWVKNIPVDMVPARCIQRKCIYCGNPKMEEQMNGFECKRCGIKRLELIYGYEHEKAVEEYNHRLEKKNSTMKFYEMARRKKVSNNKREEIDDDLPF